MTVLTAAPVTPHTAVLTSGKLPKWAPWALLAGSFVISGAVFAVAAAGADLADFNIAGAAIVGILLYMVIITVISSIVESRRKAVDRLMTALVATAFLVALLPLISLLWTVTAAASSTRSGERC
jgi:phosphate transport system permease protein